MYQSITIIGNTGRDAEFSYTPQGIPVCRFSVCVNKVIGKGDQKHEETTWFRVSLWRERAEALYSHIKKGQKVFVVGEISYSLYKDKQGQPQVTLEINANEFKFLDSKPKTAEPAPAAEQSVPEVEQN